MDPDFSLTLAPSALTIGSGQAATYQITVVATGFAGLIALSISGHPPGSSVLFDPAAIDTRGTATLMLTTSPTTPPALYTLTVTGTGGGLQHFAMATLRVWSRPAP